MSGDEPGRRTDEVRSGTPVTAGRYEIDRPIGSGGMADVYRAFDPLLKRTVALKFLRGADRELVARFTSEARAQAQVDHPNICKVYEVGEADGRPYIAMQFIEGRTLGEMYAEMPLDARVAAMADIALAVHAAHRVGLVHRDLKPSNIMLEPSQDGRWHAYVLDFGLARDPSAAKETEIGVVVGTPAYMAPEQAQGDRHRIDRRTDVWGLGATLYELLTRRPPFDGGSAMAVLMKVVAEDPPRPRAVEASVPADLETIVLKCLEKDPQRRYESARAVADDLRRYLDGEPIAARPASLVYRVTTRLRRHRTVAALLAIAAVAVIASTTVAVMTLSRSAATARAAQQFGQEIERIEAIARYSHMLPLHDVAREHSIIRRRIASIAERRKEMGRGAEGPSEYAIGRGYVSLEEYDSSRRHLEAAWKAGYRTPDVAYALGRAIGAQYDRELKETERLASKDARDRRREVLRREYREPALSYLRLSSGAATESAAYAEGLIALFEQRHDDAIRSARAAYTAVPWLYEAKLLEANALVTQGLGSYNSGGYEDAAARYAEADAVFREAEKMAPSDVSVLLGNAERWFRVMQLDINSGGEPAAAMKQGVDATERAAVANPRNEASFRTRAAILLRFGEWQALQGEVPQETLDAAIAAARQAIALRADNPRAFSQIGSAFFNKARHAATHGGDAFPFYEASIANHRRAFQLGPREAYAPLHLANSLRRYAEARNERGIESSAMLDESIEFYDKAVENDPSWANSFNDRMLAFITRAEWDMARGRDPIAALDEAIRSGNRATELNPKFAASFVNLANAYYNRGYHLLRKGQSPRQEAEAAARAALRAAEINPKLAAARMNAADAYLLNAHYELDSGADSRPSSAKALEQLRIAVELNASHAGAWGNSAFAHLCAFRSAAARGEPAASHLAAARDAIARALAIDGDNAVLIAMGASIELEAARAEGTRSAGLARAATLIQRSLEINDSDAEAWTVAARVAFARGELDRALAAADRAIALNPTEAPAHEVRGEVLTARAERGGREADAAAAAEALRKAYRINPLFGRE